MSDLKAATRAVAEALEPHLHGGPRVLTPQQMAQHLARVAVAAAAPILLKPEQLTLEAS